MYRTKVGIIANWNLAVTTTTFSNTFQSKATTEFAAFQSYLHFISQSMVVSAASISRTISVCYFLLLNSYKYSTLNVTSFRWDIQWLVTISLIPISFVWFCVEKYYFLHFRKKMRSLRKNSSQNVGFLDEQLLIQHRAPVRSILQYPPKSCNVSITHFYLIYICESALG